MREPLDDAAAGIACQPLAAIDLEIDLKEPLATLAVAVVAVVVEAGSTIIERCKDQLWEYFNGGRKVFDLPILLVGSDFQRKVWDTLLEIPYGKTMSYASLSKKLGDERAIRAVARANGENALSIIVPCHRILGSDGSLTGYAGGLRVKKKLLQLEGASLQRELNFEN